MNSKIKEIMLMYAMMGAMMPEAYNTGSNEQPTQEDIDYINKIREEKAQQRKLNKGLKEWDINGIYVIALNRKNAERKARNIAKLLKEME